MHGKKVDLAPKLAEPSQNQITVEFSLVIPVYREESRVPDLLGQIKKVIHQITPLSYEIIIVNDGSDDDTLSILLKEAKRDPHISVLSYDQNKGKGYAVRHGILHSKGDSVIFLDGDLEVSPSAISECTRCLRKYDLVIGSKAHPLSQIQAPSSRRLLSRLFNILVRYVFHMSLRDTQTGLKGGKGDILRDIFRVMRVDRFAFDVELLTIATLLNLHIKELPVIVNYNSSLKTKEVARMFFDLMAILYRYKIRKTDKIRMNQIKNKQYND